MIKNYNTLKYYCNIGYTINNEKLEIGKLTDNQLDISKKILTNKDKLSEKESKQLDAINYVINYRSKCASEKIFNDLQEAQNLRLIKRANEKATMIEKWILRNFK